MNKKIFTFLLAVMVGTVFIGCSSKEEQEYNKPAIYWYNKMIKEISNYRIDDADDTFTSLESEHRNSPLLPSATLILANAHIEDEEYAMANFYLDEYLKKYTKSNELEYIEFLKIKSNFLAFKNQFREQDLLTKTLLDVEKYTRKYPTSQYSYLVEDIKARLLMAKAVFEKEIADLYGRVDKPVAQKYYETKAKENWQDLDSIEKVDVPWYRWIFE